MEYEKSVTSYASKKERSTEVRKPWQEKKIVHVHCALKPLVENKF
jgi:hypothetical protein